MPTEDKSKVEHDIAAYLLDIGYSLPKVQEVMLRHRYKGKRTARLLAKKMNAAKPAVLDLGCGSDMNHCHLIKERPVMRYLKPLARAINLSPGFVKYALEYLNFGWIIIAKK